MFPFIFWAPSNSSDTAQQASSAWKAIADSNQHMASMTKGLPILHMLFSCNADVARNMRDASDSMAGDMIVTPPEIANLFGLQPASLNAADRLIARQIGREEARGRAGMGASNILSHL